MEDNNIDDIEDINTDNLDVLQDEASNYNTDSDIDAPKYTPTYTSQNKEINKSQTKPINPEVISRNLEDKIKFMRNDNEFKNKAMMEYENKISLLETELLKIKEKLNAKETILAEFQSLTAKSTEKLKLMQENVDNLKKVNANLVSQIDEYENQLKAEKLKNESMESNSKNIALYQEHINELQNEYTEKETKLAKKYQEKETTLKTEYLNEISKLTKQLEDLRVENEKLKFDISNLKINIDTINSKHEDEEYETKAILNKKDKEIKKLKDQLDEYAKKHSELENTLKEKETVVGTDIEKLRDEIEALTIEINKKNENIYDLEAQVESLHQNLEAAMNDAKHNKEALDNKNTVINQLKNQADELQKEIAARDSELELLEQAKTNENREYNDQMAQVIKEKNDLELYNAELSDNLSQASQKIKELNDFITDKYNSLNQSLFKERSRNDNIEKKYKGAIKNLRMREKSLIEENKQLKELLNEKEQMEYQYQNEINSLQAKLPNFKAYIGYDENLSHLIEAGSDFFIMPSRYEPCGLNQIYSLLYGTLPIVRRTGGLADTVENYNEATGEGTGFMFDQLTPDAVYNTCGWATFAYYNKKDHIKKMQKAGMSKNFTWDKSCEEYLDTYNEAIFRGCN